MCAGREAEAGRVEIGNEAWLRRDEIFRRGLLLRLLARQQPFDDGHDLGELVEADEGVDLGQRFRQFLGETLRHAAGHDEFLRVMAALQAAVAVRLQDGRDAFLLGRVDERAGVDDHHVGGGGIGGQAQSGQSQVAGDDLGIDQVLCAAERDDADFQAGGGGQDGCIHGWRDSTVKVSGSEWSLCGP